MEVEVIIFIVMIVIQICILLFIIWIMHAKIGEYPEPLPLSEDPKRELKEALLLSVLFMIVLTIFLLVVIFFYSELLSEQYSIGGLLIFTAVITIPSLVSLIFVNRVNKWDAKDLGLTTEIQQSKVFVFALIVVIVFEIIDLMSGGVPEPAPLLFLLIVIYQNSILEEFFWRGIIQSKFERAMGQVKSWKWTGIIFGLAHIFNDFMIPILLGFDIATALIFGCIMLSGQIISGWFFGIIYTKTRNLIPCIIVHYLSNYLPLIVAWFFISG